MSGGGPYPEGVWRSFRQPACAGAPVAGAAIGRGGDRKLGGDVEVWLEVRSGAVARAGFRAFGCPFTVAAADAACVAAVGRRPAELLEFDAGALIDSLGIPPERFPVRIWVEDAVRAAARAANAG